MRRAPLITLLLLGMLAVSPARAAEPTPCPAGTRIPVWFEIAAPICPGEPLSLIVRACAPCVDLQLWTFLPPGPIQVHAAMDLRSCVLDVCMPESLVVPIGTYAAGHHVLMVEVRGTVTDAGGATCHATQLERVEFDVPLRCTPPLPYTDLIRIGPPPPCASCPPPPICPDRWIPFHIEGNLPSTCYEFRGLELLPSPLMSPLPAPPIARVTIAVNDCLEVACLTVLVPWRASTMMPPLPPGAYQMMVELAEVSWCDPSQTPDTLYRTIVPFAVAAGCSIATASAPAGEARMELLAASPNPFGRGTRLALRLAEGAEVDVGVFDPGGRRVATLHRGWLAAGEHALRWDARGASGARVPDGIYFCRVSGAGAAAIRRLVSIGVR